MKGVEKRDERNTSTNRTRQPHGCCQTQPNTPRAQWQHHQNHINRPVATLDAIPTILLTQPSDDKEIIYSLALPLNDASMVRFDILQKCHHGHLPMVPDEAHEIKRTQNAQRPKAFLSILPRGHVVPWPHNPASEHQHKSAGRFQRVCLRVFTTPARCLPVGVARFLHPRLAASSSRRSGHQSLTIPHKTRLT